MFPFDSSTGERDAPANGLRMPALGEEFRRAREARGQTISDVAERLHIRSVYLTAIEDEDWASIGAPVYIRGFIRTYARYLGLDPEAAVARLAEAPPSGAVRGSAAPAGEDRTNRRGPSLAALIAILIAFGVVGFVAYQYVQFRTGGSGAVPAPVASAAAVAPAPDATEAAAAEPTPEVAPLPASAGPKPRLAIRLTETSWLRVVIDGKVALEGTFGPGTAKAFAGKAATVRVGNAGGVQIAVDGRSLGKLGAEGDVVERHLVLTGE